MATLTYESLDKAIATAEGYNSPGSIPAYANNPGDIVMGAWANTHGATGRGFAAAGGQNIAEFPNATAGFAAEDALISGNYAGGSIKDLAAGWLSGSPQSAQDAWIKNVTASIGGGATGDTLISSLAGGGTVAPETPSASTTAPSAPTAPTPPTGGSGGSPTMGQIGGWIAGAVNPAAAAMAAVSAANTASGGAGVTWGRAGAFLLALIVIGGALYLFKPVQSAVNTGVKAVAI